MTTVMKLRKIRRSTLVRFNPGSGEPGVAEVGGAGSRVAVWISRWFPQVAQKREASSLRRPHLVQYTRAPSRAALAPLERQLETETDEDSARQPLEGAHAVGDLTGSVASPRGRRAPWTGAPCPGPGRRSSSSTSPGPRPYRA